MYPMPPPRTSLPTAAGALLIIAGITGLLAWIVVLSLGGVIESMFPPGTGIGAIIVACGAIEITFALIALLGGVMALQRKNWGVALAGSILGLFLIGFLGEASILSLISLILIAISRREFL